ncbi:hypothetical protein TNIN_162121 [Trichonephila inaurata madagascariensis]|uniref:C2H2-type domain-containing protein n=1 Tax=Trichonephila inaurata madagascariensis TaxID=2747483 RepID=A0A8X7CM51_9ARAC|nr:hypothetical protein TNIN_162121 [Trichonephila inaurata madagascariensis]
MNDQNPGDDPTHVCDMCHRAFQFRRHYIKHLLVHKARVLHQCSKCLAGFISEFELSVHLSIHTEESRMKCRYCSKSLSSPFARKRHENNHTTETCLICKVCHRMFQTILLLQQHLLLHTADKPFSSDVCAAGITQIKEQKHPRISMIGKSNSYANYAGKVFVSNMNWGDIKIAITKRSGINAHSVIKESNFMRHYHNHSEEKLYTCEVCGKRFMRTGALKRHHRIHTGEKPYECAFCGKCFLDISDRSKHVRRHH